MQEVNFNQIAVTYPFSRKDTAIIDHYFGQNIADPYRWLENNKSTETKEWVQQQNLLTFGYLSKIPFRDKIKKRLEGIYNFEKYSAPFKKGGKYYFLKNDGLQNQSVLYVQESLEGEARVVLDPNAFSADATTSLQEMVFSKDGRYLAYAISEGGSDWRTILIKDIKHSNNLKDQLEWVKFSEIAWSGNGFYYTQYPSPNPGDELTESSQNSAVYYHELGTDQTSDLLIFHNTEHADRYFSALTTEDERFLIIVGSESTSGNSLIIKDLFDKNAQFVTIAQEFENDYQVIDNFDDYLLVMTNRNAPRQKLLRINITQPTENNWETWIPEDPVDVLQGAYVCGGRLICQYLHDASSILRVYAVDGKFIESVALPEIGTVTTISGGKSEQKAFFTFMSFLRPISVFSIDMKTLKTAIFKSPTLDFNPDAYVTDQIWYQSKDGIKVPMFVTRKKDLILDGKNPALLYGYGGFNISVTPGFSASRAMLLENNGIYVVANIRGGGEFGEEWHKAGTKCQKQKVFDDFIAAAEYLIAQKYTAPERIAIQGGSNGGLLVGACMTQRPDLFGVCFPQVGVLDMLRYHKFTIGYAWSVDYGRSDKAEEFPCLLKYSPLHHLKKTAYPATMVTTADHDDRVVPAHSFKFAAALQEHQQGERPALIRIETSAGHGAGKPIHKQIEEAADLLAFMFWNMKHPVIY